MVTRSESIYTFRSGQTMWLCEITPREKQEVFFLHKHNHAGLAKLSCTSPPIQVPQWGAVILYLQTTKGPDDVL